MQFDNANGSLTLNATGGVDIAKSASSAALTVTSTATGYTNGGGTVEFGRTGALTGVGGESFSNVKIAPVFQLTDPDSGNFPFIGLNIDLSGITNVSSPSGTTDLYALTVTGSSVPTVGSGGFNFVNVKKNLITSIGGADTALTIKADNLTSGKALSLTSSSIYTAAGGLFDVSRAVTGGTTAWTGNLLGATWTHNHNAAATLDHTAKGLNLSRTITSNHASAAITVSGALADLNSTNVQTLGTLTDTGNILKLTQGYASASGDVISIANSGTGKDISGNGGTWSVSKAGSIILGGSMTRNVTAVAAATYDLVVTDDILDVTYTSTAAVTSLTLPTAQMVKGRTIVIKDGGGLAGTNNITIDTEGDEQIDGADTYVMNTNWESVTLAVNAAGTGWRVISTY